MKNDSPKSGEGFFTGVQSRRLSSTRRIHLFKSIICKYKYKIGIYNN